MVTYVDECANTSCLLKVSRQGDHYQISASMCPQFVDRHKLGKLILTQRWVEWQAFSVMDGSLVSAADHLHMPDF